MYIVISPAITVNRMNAFNFSSSSALDVYKVNHLGLITLPLRS